MIGFNHHLNTYGDKYADWDSSSRSEAQQILDCITSFELLIVFWTVYQYLSHLAGITVKLQKKAIDIVEAYDMTQEIAAVYKSKRSEVLTSFSTIFKQCVTMSEKVRTEVSMPRITSRQQHRSNIAANSPED
jgi:hypothetical protein